MAVSYPVRSCYLSEYIPLQAAPPFDGIPPEFLSRDTILYALPNQSCIFVFSFGAITFIGIDSKQINLFILNYTSNVNVKRFSKLLWEDYELKINSKSKVIVKSNQVFLPRFEEEASLIISRIMAQSVAMDYYEQLADRVFENFSPINKELMQKGRLAISRKNLLRTIGLNNVIMQKIISKLHILDEPDIIWEDDLMWSLYDRLHSMFDLEDRFKTIEYKLRFVQENSQILLDSMQGRRETMLEIAIIVLIFLELVLFLYDVFL